MSSIPGTVTCKLENGVGAPDPGGRIPEASCGPTWLRGLPTSRCSWFSDPPPDEALPEPTHVITQGSTFPSSSIGVCFFILRAHFPERSRLLGKLAFCSWLWHKPFLVPDHFLCFEVCAAWY